MYLNCDADLFFLIFLLVHKQQRIGSAVNKLTFSVETKKQLTCLSVCHANLDGSPGMSHVFSSRFWIGPQNGSK